MRGVAAIRTSAVCAGIMLALIVFSLTGCGSSKFHPVYPVKGKVLVNGQPAAECLVYLTRTFDDSHPRRVTPQALTDANGEFRITSYVTNDGAPEGEYIVTMEWRERSGMMNNNFEGIDRLDGAYASSVRTKTLPGFLIKVEKKPLEIPPFKLTQSPEAKRKHDEWKKRPRGGLTPGT